MKKQRKGKGKTRQRRHDYVSFESAILLFGILNASLEKEVIERAFKLALRGPDLVKNGLRAFLEPQGVNISELMFGEPTSPVSQAEVKNFVQPFLKRGAEMATFGRIADIYLFGKELTPENVVYAFYIGTRYALVREHEPTKAESGRIWEIALWISQNSKIGQPYWKELESKGAVYLKDWLDVRKENARKRFETFLKQKVRAEKAAEDTLRSLMLMMFEDEFDKKSG